MLRARSIDKTQGPCKAEIFDSLLIAPTYVALYCPGEGGQEEVWNNLEN